MSQYCANVFFCMPHRQIDLSIVIHYNFVHSSPAQFSHYYLTLNTFHVV